MPSHVVDSVRFIGERGRSSPPTAAGARHVNFDELFDDVYPELFRYCVRMAGDVDVAEDVVQDAFVRLLDRGVRGDRAGLRAWLFKVATHRLRDGIRVRENRRRLLRERPVAPDPVATPEELTRREERVFRARRALSRLDERDRTLLLLKEEGFSYQEMADAVGVRATSIGTLLARARRRFAGALEETV